MNRERDGGSAENRVHSHSGESCELKCEHRNTGNHNGEAHSHSHDTEHRNDSNDHSHSHGCKSDSGCSRSQNHRIDNEHNHGHVSSDPSKILVQEPGKTGGTGNYGPADEQDHMANECSSSQENDDDNMHGIFLHIMADTLGSVGVIISTIIVKLTGWNFVDPIASMMIATLIFLSAIPLLKSSSSNLLLSLNNDTEEELKYLLGEVLKIPGVKSYTTPRFWPHDGPRSKLVGYLHVQYFRTENSLHIKAKIDRLFSKSDIINRFYLQLENEVDECWCRKKGIFSTY